MIRLVRLATWLYPPDWRARYGAEFDALLEDCGAGWRELADVLKGAFLMHVAGRSFAILMAVSGAVGLAAAAAIAFHLEDTYVSTAVLRMGGTREAGAKRLRQIQGEMLSRTSLSSLIQTLGLYPEERAKLPLEDIVEEMRTRHILVAPVGGKDQGSLSGAFQIRFEYPDRGKVQLVTRELASRVIHGGTPVVSFEVLDPASMPQRPSFPNRGAILAVGLALGLAAGGAVAGVRRWPIVALCGIAGALLAGGLSFAIAKPWVVSSVVRVRPAEASAQVAAAVRQAGGDVEVRDAGDGSGTLRIQASGRNPAMVQAAVQSFVARLVQQSGGQVVEVQVLDPMIPRERARVNRVLAALAGLGLGLLAGMLWQRMRRAPLPA